MRKIIITILIFCLAGFVYADLTATEGLAIDLSSAGAGTDFTIIFDPTELLGSRTWGDGSTDTIVWTWNRSTGTDPTITFNSGSLGLLGLTASGVVALGDGGDNFSVASDGIDIATNGNITDAGTIGSGAITSTGTVAGVDLTASGDIIGQDDLQLDSDAALIQLGEDQDVVLTHVADTGILLTGGTDNQLQFGDSGTYINQSTDGTLSLVADTIADITAPNIKLAVDAAAYLNVATADGGITTISQVSDGTDEIKLGDGGDLVSVASGNWDVSNAGVFSGMTGITSTGVMDFGGATSTELVNDGNPTTNAAGEIALDTTIIDHQPLWQYFDGGENMTVIAIDTAQLPAQDNEIVKYDAGTDKFVLEADASGGSTAWDDIADPDNSGLTTITFDNAELSLLTGDNDAAASFFTIQNTDADHDGGNLYLLDLDYSADDDDVDADYLKCQDSGGIVLTIQENGVLTTIGAITTTSNSITLGDTGAGDPVITFDSGNDGTIKWEEDGQDFEISGDVEVAGDVLISGYDLTIGANGDVDPTITFDADSADSTLTWDEANDQYLIPDDILFSLDEQFRFGDSAVHISSDDDGFLDIEADTAIRMDGPVDMQANALDCDSSTVTLSTVSGVIDAGGATSLEIPNGTDPDVGVVGQISQDTNSAGESNDESFRGYDGAAQFLIARKLKMIQATIIKPNDMADAQRDQTAIWHNNSGMIFTVEEIWAWSDVDDTDVNVEIVTATDWSSPSTLDALSINVNGTSIFYVTETTISDDTVAHDEIIVLDFDDTDDPGMVKINIIGWFNSDVAP
jgi:hypothetical protein